MGANTSKSAHQAQQKPADEIDFGSTLPSGIYSSAQPDSDPRIVRNLIMSRKMAPFYKGLADPPDPVPDLIVSPQASTSSLSPTGTQLSTTTMNRTRSASTSRVEGIDPHKQHKEQQWKRERLYNDAVECPICFLYYPANINYSRCCDQPICTECFIQIRRRPETPQSPAGCPFCLEENYGIVYERPTWSRGSQTKSATIGPHTSPAGSGTRHTTWGIASGSGPRRKSTSHKSADVVLVDHIRPDWKKAMMASSGSAGLRRNSLSAGSSLTRTFLGSSSHQQSLNRGRSASSSAIPEYNQYFVNLEELMLQQAINLSLEYEAMQQQAATPASEQDPPAVTDSAAVSPPGSSSLHHTSSSPNDDDDNTPLAVTTSLPSHTSSPSPTSLSVGGSTLSSSSPSSSNHPPRPLPASAGPASSQPAAVTETASNVDRDKKSTSVDKEDSGSSNRHVMC